MLKKHLEQWSLAWQINICLITLPASPPLPPPLPPPPPPPPPPPDNKVHSK